MNDQIAGNENHEQQGPLARFATYHWNELLSLTPRELAADVIGLWGIGEALAYRDDGVRVLKGMGKIVIGVVLANTGGSTRRK